MMLIPPEILRTQLDYTAWASSRLVHAAGGLTAPELLQDFGTADKSILGTLAHVFAADRVWLYRVAGGPDPGFVTDADRSLAVLENDWPALHQRWSDWAAGWTPESLAADVTYKDRTGKQGSTPLWLLIMHVVNHGSHHRGQVAGFLRTLGHTPPPIDLSYYYRQYTMAGS